MANVDRGRQYLTNYRYSIKQLLALSGTACVSFDLSKFSFDAARAGVIPSLGDCAMSSRRSSANHPRVSSAKSASTTEDVVVFAGTDAQAPERRPQPPPITILAQHNTGFARFLKKHTSPTHQRVTAGGRIVPMEPRQAPPVFALNANVEEKPLARKLPNYTEEVASQVKRSTAGVPIPGADHTKITMLNHTANPNSQWAAQSLNTVYSAPIHYPSLPGGCFQSVDVSHISAMHPNPAAGNVPPHSVWQTMCPNPNLSTCSPMGFWPYAESTADAAGQVTSDSMGYLSQPIIWAQNALAEWSQRYNELDQQLKALDRHRATRNLTADIANQRREIVQQRSDSKNMINLITSWLNLSEQVQSDPDPRPHSLDFNANAPAYVPMSQLSHSLVSRIGSGDGLKETTQKDVFQKPPTRSARRPLAIVPPPELQPATSPAKKENAFSVKSPNHNEVDAWGVKIGPAPADLRKQQSEILESISEAHSQSSRSNKSRESLRSVPQGGFFQQSGIGATAGNIAQQAPNRGGPVQSDSKNVSSDAEVMYQERSNALRQPNATAWKSVSSHIGDEDQHRQQSSPSEMTRLERAYWLRTPLPQQCTQHTCESQENEGDFGYSQGPSASHSDQEVVSSRRGNLGPNLSWGGNDKENVAVTPTARRKAATDAFLARFNGDSQEDISLSQEEAQVLVVSARPMPNKDEKLRAAPHNRLDVVKVDDHGESFHQECSDDRTHGSRVGHAASTVFDQVQNMSRTQIRPVNVSADAFNNKGYSSISVQNINAVAQLPQNFDGSTDRNKTSRSTFSLVGKVKSPHLLRRTTATGGA